MSEKDISPSNRMQYPMPISSIPMGEHYQHYVTGFPLKWDAGFSRGYGPTPTYMYPYGKL